MLTTYAKISAAQLAFFSLALLITIYVLIRHVRKCLLPWMYFAVFSILRIAGSSLVLSAQPSDFQRLLSAAILSAAGTTLLVLALQGLLFESAFQHVWSQKRRNCHTFMFAFLQASTWVSLFLTSIGGAYLTSLTSPNPNLSHIASSPRLLKGGAFFLVHAYIGTLILSIIILSRRHRIPSHPSRRLLYATILSMPFMLVRIIYAVAIVFGLFGKNSGIEGVGKKLADAFVVGKPGVWLGMAVLMEWAVMKFCLGAGVWTAGSISKEVAGRKMESR